MKTILVLWTLFSTINAVKVVCKFEMAKYYLPIGEVYTCDVKNVTMTGSQVLEAVTGTHLAGKSNADVKQFYFGPNCNKITFIPKNITNLLPKMKGLGFSGDCYIEALTGDELNGYNNLEWFYIASNPIERIPGNLFQNIPKIKVVGFSNTNITRVGAELLSGLDSLVTAFFHANPCINEMAINNRTGVLHLIENLKQTCPDYGE
jgi:hypothetical protein